MPKSSRSRMLNAPQQRVWELVEDPHHMPRWWPGVERMENVDAGHFTQVYVTKRGRPVRMDFQLLASEAPWRRAWSQEVAGTPFQRVLNESITEVVLEPEGERTRVTIALAQKLRGYSRTGGFLLGRTMRRRLDEALDGLASIV